jgi:hypothetical protein
MAEKSQAIQLYTPAAARHTNSEALHVQRLKPLRSLRSRSLLRSSQIKKCESLVVLRGAA